MIEIILFFVLFGILSSCELIRYLLSKNKIDNNEKKDESSIDKSDE